jgi:glycosyltransferase involved in cell wall biosynthesis
MSQPFFSIVLVNYNYGRFLPAALQSIYEQSFQDFEIIVVDGGSTDESVPYLQTQASRLAWWVSEPDRGQSDAFNKGFAQAKGKYGLWLNTDDLLLPGALAEAHQALTQSQAPWASSDYIRVTEGLRVISCHRGFVTQPPVLQRWGAPVSVCGPSSFFALDLLRSVGGFDPQLRYAMDIDLWLKFMQRGIYPYRYHHYSWAFRMHEASKTADEFADHYVNPRAQAIRDEVAQLSQKLGYQMSFTLRALAGFYKIQDGSAWSAWRDTKSLRGQPCAVVGL